MKIGIVTITDGSNYGNNLQNYAVINLLEGLGMEAETVKTDYEYSLSSLILSKLKRKSVNSVSTEPTPSVSSDNEIKEAVAERKPSGKFDKIRRIAIRQLRAIRFNAFNKKYLKKSKTACVENNPSLNERYDYLVFGSDQIWNYTLNRINNGARYYSGDFNDEINKIAFSASIGVDYIPDEFKELFRNSVNKFKAVSVREANAKNTVEEYYDGDVSVIPDPTLLVDKDEWIKIARKPRYVSENEKYLLTYFLGDISESVQSFINGVAEAHNLKAVNLTMEWAEIINKGYYCTAPDEFVWLVNNAELVLTDSFHACAFSVIFEKPFRFFNRLQAGLEKMTSRVDSLAETLHIDKWYTGDVNEELSHVFYKDYSEIDGYLTLEKEKAISFLSDNLK